MSLKELALKIAESAHKDQVDKAGKPYINHPLTVASAFEDDLRYSIAILHDVLEDSDITFQDLIDYGFSSEVIEALMALTKNDEGYNTYLEKVKLNSLALDVKLEDLKHNMDLSRIKNPTEKDYERLKKYEYAIEYLKK
ncbi:HD domain-containing protein [Alkalibaculum sp. M08DMB]|uniref:HD domain-containing protein n=1 Tax=Alkalibaculum sporogenes TaxID=2655001 RepID=A0A6A7K986_9FIRM|nr:HD domain-containing protein [Alkalibaculum sporogenes]MPW25956.1 HD domain-containing protein [Alkalibaculum sporogenes]